MGSHGRHRALIALALAACGSKAPRVVTPIGNTVGGDTYGGEAYGGDTYGGGDDEDCTDSEAQVGRFVTNDGESATLKVCRGEQHVADGNTAEDGFVTYDMTARLVVDGADGTVLVDDQIDAYDNGWEWGNDYVVLGELADPRGVAAIVVVNKAYDETGGRDTLTVWVVAHGAWSSAWSENATSIEAEPDGDQLHVTLHEGGESDPYAPDSTETVTTVELAFAGGAITELSRASDADDSDD